MIPDPGSVHFRTYVGELEQIDCPCLMIGAFQGLERPEGALARVDDLTDYPIQNLIDSGEIRGSFKEFTMLHLGEGKAISHVLVMGLGKREEFTVDRVRSVVAKAVRTFRKIGRPQMAVLPCDFPADPADVSEAVVEGSLLGLYKFDKYYHEHRPRRRAFDEVCLAFASDDEIVGVQEAINRGSSLGWATLMARNLANEPGNVRTPQAMAEQAEAIAKCHGLAFRVFDEKSLKQMRMGGILAVGAAAEHPPRLIELRYDGGGPQAPTLGVVGKGVTFDAGGLSIKGSTGMWRMKYDMSGGAAALGIIDAIAQMELPLNVLCLVPCAENVIGSKGYRPGDVIRMYNGRHVEILNTDAEGRLLLADALAYACDQGVDLVVDMATLTGGVVSALGHAGSGLMSNNDWAADQMMAAGGHCAEKLWRLPLWEEYGVHLKSIVAEMVNCHESPAASTATAGMFLQAFVGDTPWVHLDIAGTAWIGEDSTLYYHKPYLPKRGATGVPVRTVTQFARRIVEACKGSKPMCRALLESEA